MRTTTIRWPDRVHAMIGVAAEMAGVSFSSYVREATLMRACIEMGMGLAADNEAIPAATRIAAREGGYAAVREWLEEQGQPPR